MKILVAALLLLAGACQRPEAQAAPPPGAAEPTQQSGADAAKADFAKTLALVKPHGKSKDDEQILKMQEAVTHNPGKAEAWVELGNAWVRKARDTTTPQLYLNGDACAQVALSISPGSRLALNLHGLSLMNDHKFEEARALAQAIVQREPDAQAYGTLSDALLELGRYAEAVQAAQQMMDLKPNLPSYSRAAYLLWLRGEDAGAKASVRLAMDAGQDQRGVEPRAWVTVQAAMIFWNEGDAEGALAGFDRALRDVPGYPPALIGKGRLAIAKGDGNSAVGLLEQASHANPLIETLWLLGDARLLAGDAAGAEKSYAQVEQGGPALDPRTTSLFLSTKSRKPELALQLAEGELKVRGDLYTQDAAAWALYRAGRFEAARAAIDRARSLGTQDARLLFHDGAIRLAQGDVKGGRKLLEDALKLNPGFDLTGSQEARALLGQKEKLGQR